MRMMDPVMTEVNIMYALHSTMDYNRITFYPDTTVTPDKMLHGYHSFIS